MINGIGPNTFAAGSLESKSRLWFENGLNFRPSCKLTLPSGFPELPGSLWYRDFPSEHGNYTGRHYCKLSISLSHKDINRYDLAAAAFMDEEQGIHILYFMNMSKVYGGNHFLVPRSENFNLTDFGQVWSSEIEDDPIEGLVVFSVLFTLLLLSMFYGGIHLALELLLSYTSRVHTLENFCSRTSCNAGCYRDVVRHSNYLNIERRFAEASYEGEKKDRSGSERGKRKGIQEIRFRTPLNSPATTCSRKRKGQVVKKTLQTLVLDKIHTRTPYRLSDCGPCNCFHPRHAERAATLSVFADFYHSRVIHQSVTCYPWRLY